MKLFKDIDVNKLNDDQKEVYRKYYEIVSVIRNVKNALIDNYYKEHCFKDMNSMKEQGILADASALISLLLMVEGFYGNSVDKEGKVVDPVMLLVETEIGLGGDLDKIREIHKETLLRIWNSYKSNGFSACPLVSDGCDRLFNTSSGEASYIDTVTYVLSATILSQWLHRGGQLAMDEETYAINFELMAVSLDILLNAQQEDGRWGFRADHGAERSLYFTYSAGVTLADFFDYIMGEIAYTIYADLDLDKQEAKVLETCDDKLLEKLDKFYKKGEGYTRGRVLLAREQIQKWLVIDCLPRIPKLAQCDLLRRDTDIDPNHYHPALGIWEIDRSNEYTRYFCLNYFYYLLDLMIIHKTDEYYDRMKKDESSEQFTQLRETCDVIWDVCDFDYYFPQDDGEELVHTHDGETIRPIDLLWKDIIAQGIHASRNKYMTASRTGELFWNKAELKIRWEHTDRYPKRDCQILADDPKFIKNVTDPSIVPLALRANTNFSYYISQKADTEVDRLFVDICKEIAETTEGNTVTDLWDRQSYNLQLTERSLEAVLDYYDYLNQLEGYILAEVLTEDEVADPTGNDPVKSPFEQALEDKIAEYLQSDAGKRMIANAVEARVSAKIAPPAQAATTTGGLNADSLRELIDQMIASGITDFSLEDADPEQHDVIRFMRSMTEFWNLLRFCSIKRQLQEEKKQDPKPGEWKPTEYNDYADSIVAQLGEMFFEMARDCRDNDVAAHHLKNLYNGLISHTDKKY